MKFVLLGNHNSEWIAKPRERGEHAFAKCVELGIEVLSSYYVQGRYDFCTIVDAPSAEVASHFSLWYSAVGFGKIETMRGYETDEINAIADSIRSSGMISSDKHTIPSTLSLREALSSEIYAGYDQQGLDREYNPRITSPNFQDVIDGWSLKSADARSRFKNTLDIPYGDSEMERLDFFPADSSGKPFYIFFHGGYWRSQDKDSQSFIANTFVPAGFNLIVPNYTLCPDVTMDVLLQQCMKAVHWVSTNAREMKGRPEIHLSGHSAGAHIVTMALTNIDRYHLKGVNIRSALAVSGLYNLEPLRRSFLNAEIRLDQAAVARNSPVGNVQRVDVPLMLVVGEHESNEFHAQTRLFHEEWQKKGNSSVHLVADGCDHYNVMDLLGSSDSGFAQQAVQHALCRDGSL